MTRVLLILAALVALVLPATAAADDLPDLSTLDFHPAAQDAVVGRYVATAEQVWPGSWCNGREQVAWYYQPTTHTLGLAWPDDQCRFAVNFAMLTGGRDRRDVCSVMVHEFGHLARGDTWHSDTPGDPLYWQFQRWPACYPQAIRTAAVA